MNITIVNWDKYKPRKDIENMPWIKLPSDIAFGEELFGLKAEVKWLWIFLLGYSAKKISGHFSISEEFISFHMGMCVEEIRNGVNQLEKRGIIIGNSELGSTNSELMGTNSELVDPNSLEEKKRKEKKREENPDSFQESPSLLKDEKLSAKDIVTLWNTRCEDFGMAKVQVLNSGRSKLINGYLKHVKDLDEWAKVFEVTASRGFVKDGYEFTPGFDYMLTKKMFYQLYELSKLEKKKKELDPSEIERLIAGGVDV